MINLLRFEWRKLWQQKSLYVLLGLGLVSTVLFMILSQIMLEIFHVSPSASESVLAVLQYSSYPTILGVFLALFACQDFTQHTIKNVYARGYSRSAVYFSKYLVSLGVAIVMALFYMAFGFIFALIQGGTVTTLTDYQCGNWALQFLVVFGLHGLYFGISMMFGKLAGSLIVNLAGIDFFFVLANSIFSIAKIDFDITKYNLEVVLTTLMTDPLSQGDLIRAIVMPICYAVVFVGLGWLINRRRDV